MNADQREDLYLALGIVAAIVVGFAIGAAYGGDILAFMLGL